MTIVSVSKEKREATITLGASELVELCNALFLTKEYREKEVFYHMYGNLMMVRDLSQYGHIDGFSFNSIAECREKANERR